MSTRVFTRWLAFAAYVAGFLTAPFAVLWGVQGAVVGAVLTVSFLILLGWRGSPRIAARLGVSRLSRAQEPVLFAMVQEYSRRLQLPTPQLGLLDSPALNLGCFGFRRDKAWLVVTEGALRSLKREELSALVGRQLCQMWYGDYIGESWLAQFFAVLDGLVAIRPSSVGGSGRRTYSFRLFLRQTILYPLTLVPSWLLCGRRDPARLDVESTKLTRKPLALTEGLRRTECLLDRAPLKVPFSARHLFLVTPVAQDPILGVFFDAEDLQPRIRHIQKSLFRVVSHG